MKKIELLAPAGNMESLKAAIYGGCDAVYVGGKFFGARSFAGNFSLDELKEAISFAHLYGVKVYVTVNILIYENEVKAFEKYIDALVGMHVDAVIMQDLGMIHLVRTIYPDLEVHASTQMHTHTLEGVLFAESLGLKRAVLAREVDIDTIQEIKKNSNIELEVFGHGALCMSYSGQCLMSSLLGGRSGNRGTCAQCCRQMYSLCTEDGKKIDEGYLLSTKDLNTLPYIGAFIESGISSLKIEGRMKRPEYVYKVTQLYRKAIDTYYKEGKVSISENDILELKKLFNRNFTKGYLFHEQNDKIVHPDRPNHMGIQIGKVIEQNNHKVTIALEETLSRQDGIRILNDKKDVGLTVSVLYQKGNSVPSAEGGKVTIPIKGTVSKGDLVIKTTDFKQLQTIRNEIKQENRKVNIEAHITLKENERMHLIFKEGIYQVEVDSDSIIEKAEKVPTTKEMIQKSICKLGSTVYTCEKCTVELNTPLFVPVVELNTLRRKAISLLEEKRLIRKVVNKQIYKVPDIKVKIEEQIGAFVQNEMQYEQVKDKVNYIYAEPFLYTKLKDPKVFLKLPGVMRHYPECNTIPLISEVGSLYSYKKSYTDASFGVVNSYTIYLLHLLGSQRVTLSHELNLYQIEKMLKAYKERYQHAPNTECIVYGTVEAMLLKYNPLKAHHIKDGNLIDRFGNKYPILEKENYNILYHYEPSFKENIEEIKKAGVTNLRYNFLKEKEIANILNL
ncbi:MAG: U32 family peptidase [Bacilli bacterium]|nr:U32 family peptidase [Bacilli bacterium]